MPVVKRYPNRKLYDTEAKQYITLEGIADLIRQGREVRVVDHAAGEDLTTLVLAQIILEQEKKRAGFLPQAVLMGLVRAGGDTLGALQRALSSSLDLLRQVDAEIERRVQALVSQGELAEEEGFRLRAKLLALGRPDPAAGLSDRALARAIRRRTPTRQDVQKLIGQMDDLAAQLDSLARPEKSA